MKLRITLTIALTCLGISATVANGQNWPQWRGSNFNSVSDATDLPVKFGREKNLLWRTELPGAAGASPIVWEDRIFLTSGGESDRLLLMCFGVDGEALWEAELEGQDSTIPMDHANRASPSPCTDGERVWAMTGAGFLQCFDMDGEPVWTVDLQERYGNFDLQFGMSSTPVLFEGILYLQLIHGNMRDATPSLGHVVAIDGATGDEIWHTERRTDGVSENKHSYASPIIVVEDEARYLLTHGGDYAVAYSLEGNEIWRCGGLNPKDNYNNLLRLVASPNFSDGQIILPSAKGGVVLALDGDLDGDVTDQQDVLAWQLDRGSPDVATPVGRDGLVYLARENGQMVCIDNETGVQVYRKRMFADRHRATPVIADGKLYIAGRNGTIVVVAEGREGEILAENELGEETTSSPAVTDGRIYIRTWNALYCFANE